MTKARRFIIFILVAAAAAGSRLLAVDDAVVSAFLAKARAAQARDDERGLHRLVSVDRWAAFGAFYSALGADALSRGSLEERLASAYDSSFGDRALVDALAVARTWTPALRDRRRLTFEWRNAGRRAMSEGKLEEAARSFARALSVYRALGDAREEAWSHSNLGAVAAVSGEGRKALESLDRAAAGARRAGDLELLGVVGLNRAYVLEDLGETDRALAAYDEALEASRATRASDSEGRILASRGTLLMKSGRLEEAAADYLGAAEVGRRSGDLEVEAVGWQNLAGIRGLRGEREEQVRLLRRAAATAHRGGLTVAEVDSRLALARVARTEGSPDEAARQLAICREALAGSDDAKRLFDLDFETARLALDRGRYAEGLTGLDRAEQRIEGIVLGGDRRASLLLSRGVALFYLGDYDGAVEQLRASVAQARRDNRPGQEGFSRAQLGYVLFTLGDGVTGQAELEKAVAIAERVGNRNALVDHLDAIGYVRYRAGDLRGARRALEQALSKIPPRGDAERAAVLKDLGLVSLEQGGAERARGRDLLRRARGLFIGVNDPQEAFQTDLLEADAALRDGDIPGTRLALARAAAVPAARTARQDAWLRQYLLGRLALVEGNRDEARSRYERAVSAVEDLRRGAGPPVWRAALLEDRVAPYRDLVALLAEDGEIEAAWRVARAAKARTFVESLDPVDLPGPDGRAGTQAAYTLRAHGNSSAGTLRALLGPGETMIDFFVSGPEVIAFVVDRERVAARTFHGLRVDDTQAALWPGRPAGQPAVTSAWRHALRRIGDDLFDPLTADLAGTRRLLIVPTGGLQSVPFAAVEFHGEPLAGRFEIAVLPAAEALLSRKKSPGEPQGNLVMGDPASTGPRLPAAVVEARSIASRMTNVNALIGADATEPAFRALAPGADRIHIAAHGRIDRIAPARTYISLVRGGGEDGRLEAGEVAGMKLRSSLVVLSGCGTGVEGPVARGDAPSDERIGLPRAFLEAGAGTVVASLWEIDDAAAAAIMPRFYDRLRSQDATAALASLQRDLAAGRIRGEGGRLLDHPYYWAGLVAWGAGLGPGATDQLRGAHDE